MLPCLIKLSKEDELELATCETDSMAVFKVKKITGGWRLKDSRCGWLSAGTKASYSLMFQERETEKTNEIDIKFSDEGNARISFVKFKMEDILIISQTRNASHAMLRMTAMARCRYIAVL